MERKTLPGRSHGNCAQKIFGFHVQDQLKYCAIQIHIQRVPLCVGPCHHGMARPQVADGGTASDMEGSCE